MNALLKWMLKGSAVSAIALTMAAAGCSDSDKATPGAGGDDGEGGANAQAGETSKSGSTNGGDSGTVGGGGAKADGGTPGDGGAKTEGGAAGEGGAEAGGAAGEGGSGGASDGIAAAKFCNTRTKNDLATIYILQVGEGADAVTFTAPTGQCVPADGLACKAVPAGPAVLVQLFNATAPTVAVDAGPLEILDGERLLFFTDISANQEIWNAAAANEGVTCEELTYDDVP